MISYKRRLTEDTEDNRLESETTPSEEDHCTGQKMEQC